MSNRWWVYQQERFPVFAHGALILLFCLSVLLFSSLQQEQPEFPSLLQLGAAFVSIVILFFQLRVADEFKDHATDCRYRPQRPVPRGLVSLRELAAIAYAGAAVQFAIALFVDVGLVPVLATVWLYLGLMTREFFVPDWLRRRPLVYLFSHMLIMPIVAFYVSAFDWLSVCRERPQGLFWLLALSFCCGLVLELGRKIRTPGQERNGVETYSALWGSATAVSVWIVAVAVAVAAYAVAASYIAAASLYLPVSAAVLLLGLAVAAAFPRRPARNRRQFAAMLIEPGSGLIALILYGGLGPLQAVLGQ